MSLNNPSLFDECKPAGYDGLFDWDFIIPCFHPTKVKPMDIDGIIERRNHFLIFETKQASRSVPEGQKITLRNLHKTGFFTIIILYGKTAQSVERIVWWPEKQKGVVVPFDNAEEKIKQLVSAWWDYANGKTNKIEL